VSLIDARANALSSAEPVFGGGIGRDVFEFIAALRQRAVAR
jgi:hypothetical protein